MEHARISLISLTNLKQEENVCCENFFLFHDRIKEIRKITNEKEALWIREILILEKSELEISYRGVKIIRIIVGFFNFLIIF